MGPWLILFILLVGGLLLLLVEFVLIPGFGLAGVTGLAAIVFSIGYAIFAAFIQQSIAVNTALTFIFSSIIVSAGLVVLALKYLPKTAIGRRLILESSFKSEAGYVGSNENLEHMAGATGRTLTLLRPAGMAEIKGYRVDVVSEGEFISEQTEVKVIKVEGNRVVVARIEEIEPDATDEQGDGSTDNEGEKVA